MSEIRCEPSLAEEIKALPIENQIRERLLYKLDRDYREIAEFKAIVAKEREESYQRIVPLREANERLTEACAALAQAMISQRRVQS